MRPPISTVIPTFNNIDRIGTLLRELRWADELLVCDSGSTDGTIEVAGLVADRVLVHEYECSARQKNWAIPQARYDWVLIVDTDERVPVELRREIEAALENARATAGFRIPRRNIVCGRPLEHGLEWPDYQTRLFRKDLGRYEDRWVHAHVILEGPCGTLTSPLLHYPHATLDSIRRNFLDRYTDWEALERHKSGMHFGWRNLLLRPAGAFLHRYYCRQGFRDGRQGAFMAAIWAIYVFVTQLKMRRLEQAEL
ncbi:MAG TPA: glycosyltransferase family 2 protein [Chloroflexota bacterium]|nr:glycosyltransferase family 2 protein [Chloroflexota bacterium]